MSGRYAAAKPSRWGFSFVCPERGCPFDGHKEARKQKVAHTKAARELKRHLKEEHGINVNLAKARGYVDQYNMLQRQKELEKEQNI